MYCNLYMLTAWIFPAVLLAPIDPASFDNRHVKVIPPAMAEVAPHNSQTCHSHEPAKSFDISVQADHPRVGKDHTGSTISSKALCIFDTASVVLSICESGASVAGANIDSHRIFVNGGFQTELELSSQDQAAEPPDTAYASIMPCTAP